MKRTLRIFMSLSLISKFEAMLVMIYLYRSLLCSYTSSRMAVGPSQVRTIQPGVI